MEKTNTKYTNQDGLHIFEADYNGQNLVFESGLLANQASGSVTVTLGSTTVLATVVVGKKKDSDYFPLQVVYEEKFYSTGKMKDSLFNKREGKPSDNAVLTGRMIDRSLRSVFDESIRNEMQIVVTTLQNDKINKPDTIAVLAASLSLKLSRISKTSNIYANQKEKMYYCWDYLNQSFVIHSFKDIDNVIELYTQAENVFEKSSIKIYALIENDYTDKVIVLVAGVSTNKNAKLESKDMPENTLNLLFSLINAKKIYLKPLNSDFESLTIGANNLVCLDKDEKIDNFESISSVRIGLSSEDLLKSYISFILTQLKNNASFEQISDNLVQVITSKIYGVEISKFLQDKLEAVNSELKTKFIALEADLGINSFHPLNELNFDPEKLEFIVNPSYEDIKNSELDLIVSGSKDNITMIETGANLLPKDLIFMGFEKAVESINELCLLQDEYIQKILDNTID